MTDPKASLITRLQARLSAGTVRQAELTASVTQGPVFGDLLLILTDRGGGQRFESPVASEWPELRELVQQLSPDAASLTRGHLRVVIREGEQPPTIVYSDDLTQREKHREAAASRSISSAEVAEFILSGGRDELAEGRPPEFADVWSRVRPHAARLLDQSGTEDGIRLVEEHGRYLVYRSERGVRNELLEFATLLAGAEEKARRIHDAYRQWTTRHLLTK